MIVKAVFVVFYVLLDHRLHGYMVVDNFHRAANVHDLGPRDHDPDRGLEGDHGHGPNRDHDPNHDHDCRDCIPVIDDLCLDYANVDRFCLCRDHGRGDLGQSEDDHDLDCHFSEIVKL